MESNSEILLYELNLLRQQIIINMQRANQPATGKTISLLSTGDISDTHGELLGAKWMGALENGSSPTRKKGNSTYEQLVTNWYNWIEAKGISVKDEKDQLRLAKFFVWYKSKFGTKLYRNGGRRDIYTPAIETMTSNLINKISKQNIESILNKI